MAYVCGACRCQSCKLDGDACKEVRDICKKCNGSRPPKCKHGKKSKLDELLDSV
jgi:hypothetical protein